MLITGFTPMDLLEEFEKKNLTIGIYHKLGSQQPNGKQLFA
jgi:hypothetical protein